MCNRNPWFVIIGKLGQRGRKGKGRWRDMRRDVTSNLNYLERRTQRSALTLFLSLSFFGASLLCMTMVHVSFRLYLPYGLLPHLSPVYLSTCLTSTPDGSLSVGSD